MYIQERGKGRPMVLVHGWGLNGGVWEEWLDHLGPHWRTFTVDLPGFGRSPIDGEANSLNAVAKEIVAGVPQEAVWLGWSLGGLVALEAALRFPNAVSALVLLAATPRFTPAPDWPCGIDPEIFQSFEADVIAHPEETLHRFALLAAHGGTQAKAVSRQLWERMLQFGAPDSHALKGGLRLLADTDLRQDVVKLDCPALWMIGGRDALVPGSAAGLISALSRQIRTVTIPDAAHTPFLSHPQQCLHLVTEFLGEHRFV
jgi:pimeloyl-[acyl-carrier protein] methyl ester esterase